MLDAAKKILRFLVIYIEVAIPRNPKRVERRRDQTVERSCDVMFLDQFRQVDVVPAFVFAPAARHHN